MSSKRFNSPYEHEAYLALCSAENVCGHLFIQAGDLQLLSLDLIGVAAEDVDGELCERDDKENAFQASRVLLERVGGFRNLESYMKCLRVPVR